MALNDKQLAWVIQHYKHTKNDEICAKLGISTNYLHTIARRHGLKKSKQFMKKCQAAAVVAAKIAVENEDGDAKALRAANARKNSEKGRFQKGKWALAKKTEEQLAAINAKRAESWHKTRYDDEVRLNWGYAQETKFRYARLQDNHQNQCLMHLRHNLRKCGYEIPQRSGMVVYIVATTKRSPKREKNAQKYGMIIRVKESQ